MTTLLADLGEVGEGDDVVRVEKDDLVCCRGHRWLGVRLFASRTPACFETPAVGR